MRQIVVVEVTRVQTSCGFGVPVMRVEESRTMLIEWAEKKGMEGLAEYRQRKNKTSIDGLPTGIWTDERGIGLERTRARMKPSRSLWR